MGRGQAFEFDAVIGNEFFVGGDYAFAGFEGAAHPNTGLIEATDQLDDHVYVGGQHGVRIFAPDYARRDPRNALAATLR